MSEYLRARDVEVFYPTVKVRPVNPRAATIRPYFPRYVFVRVDLANTGMSALKWLPGAVGLVEFGGEAARVPDNVIHRLEAHVDALRAAGEIDVNSFRHGESVRITTGPLAEYEAIFDVRLNSSDRVRVLLEMLGRRVGVEVKASELERQSASRAARV